jgi:hypothetical protein
MGKYVVLKLTGKQAEWLEAILQNIVDTGAGSLPMADHVLKKLLAAKAQKDDNAKTKA